MKGMIKVFIGMLVFIILSNRMHGQTPAYNNAVNMISDSIRDNTSHLIKPLTLRATLNRMMLAVRDSLDIIAIINGQKNFPNGVAGLDGAGKILTSQLPAETDPNVPSWVKTITSINISNWNSAFGWGNHATAGYLNTTTGDARYAAIAHFHRLFQLQDVHIVSPAGGEILQFNGLTSLWENKPIGGLSNIALLNAPNVFTNQNTQRYNGDFILKAFDGDGDLIDRGISIQNSLGEERFGLKFNESSGYARLSVDTGYFLDITSNGDLVARFNADRQIGTNTGGSVPSYSFMGAWYTGMGVDGDNHLNIFRGGPNSGISIYSTAETGAIRFNSYVHNTYHDRVLSIDSVGFIKPIDNTIDGYVLTLVGLKPVWAAPGGGGGSGTVTIVSTGNLSPLFTASISNPSSTPALSFSLANAAAHKFFGNFTGSTGAPSYSSPLLTADFSNEGTTTTLLHGNAAGNFIFGAVGLPTDVTGILPDGNLSSNVALKNASNIFTQKNTFPSIKNSFYGQGLDTAIVIRASDGAVAIGGPIHDSTSFTNAFFTVLPGIGTKLMGGDGYQNYGFQEDVTGNAGMWRTSLGEVSLFSDAWSGHNQAGISIQKGGEVTVTGDIWEHYNFPAQAHRLLYVGNSGVIVPLLNDSIGSVLYLDTISATSDVQQKWLHPGTSGYILTMLSNGRPAWQPNSGGGGSGTVTNFTSGNLSPLFTTSVSNPTTVPSLTFSLNNAAAHTFLGNTSSSSAAPSYSAITTSDLPTGIANANLANSSITWATPGTSGTAPNWGASSTSLGGTATINIPMASISSVTAGLISKTQYDVFNAKQDALVSGTNIKTVNSTSLLGSGNITISGGSTDLGYTQNALNNVITPSTGTSATLLPATTSLAGLFDTLSKRLVDSIHTGAWNLAHPFVWKGISPLFGNPTYDTIRWIADSALVLQDLRLSSGQIQGYFQGGWVNKISVTSLFPSQTGNSGKYLTTDGSGTLSWATVTSGGSGTVTDFSAGDLSPLFTTTEATTTTTPALTFTLSNASAHKFFGNFTGSTGAPSYGSPILASADFANQGTTTTLLHGNASGNPSWAAVSLTADITGALAIANGGVGFTTYTTGDIIIASATNTLSKLAAGTNTYVLTMASGVPAWVASSGTISGLTSGRISFANSSSTITDDAALLWDNTNKIFKTAIVTGLFSQNVYGAGAQTTFRVNPGTADANGLISGLTVYKNTNSAITDIAFDFQTNNSVYSLPTITAPNGFVLDGFGYRSIQMPAGQNYYSFYSKAAGGSALGRIQIDGNADVSGVEFYNTDVSISNGSGPVSPATLLYLDAGTTSKSPFHITAGPIRTTAQAGNMDYDGDWWYITDARWRHKLDQYTVFTGTADATVNNTTTETTIIPTGVGTLTFPANFFTSGKTLVIKLQGTIRGNSGGFPTPTFKLKTSDATVSLPFSQVTSTSSTFEVEYVVTCRTTGSSGAFVASGKTLIHSINDQYNPNKTFTSNTTTAQTLDFTITWDLANTLNSITVVNAIVEVKN